MRSRPSLRRNPDVEIGATSRRDRARIAAIAAFVLVTAACGSTSSPSGSNSPTSAAVKVGMALTGPRNDGGFSESHYNGLLQIEEEFGAEVTVVDNATDPQAELDAIRNLAAAGNQLVIGAGAQFGQAAVVLAPEFPDVEFAIINGQPSDAPNLHVYLIRQGVPAYVAGVVAGNLTKAQKVGFVGGAEIPPTTQSDDGFRAGVLSVNPAIEYSSTIVGDFNDAARAAEATAAQIAQGADVIFAFVNAGFPGAVRAVEDSGKNVLLINPILSQCDSYTGVVGFALLNTPNFVTAIYQDFVNNTLPAQPKAYGIEDASIQAFQLCPEFATAELETLVGDTTQEVNSGAVSFPTGV